MKKVEAHILLYELQTNLEAPDPVTETWGPFASPGDESKAVFTFDDQKGTVSLIINHNWSISVVVTGTVSDEIMESPNPYEHGHYQPFLEFYIRAFEVVNHFISRFRLRLFRYDNAPINWSVREASVRGQSGAYFAVHSRIKFSESWFIDDEPFDLLKELLGGTWLFDGHCQKKFSNGSNKWPIWAPSLNTPKKIAVGKVEGAD
jgi:hypothetical protein